MLHKKLILKTLIFIVLGNKSEIKDILGSGV